MSGAHTILIVDNDVGFVWWLGAVSTEIGCHSVPALNCAQAQTLVKKLQLSVNLLIVNPTLSGIGQLIKSLNNSDLKVVAIFENNTFAFDAHGVHYDATITRPSGWEPVSSQEWQRKMKTLLKQLQLTCSSETTLR